MRVLVKEPSLLVEGLSVIYSNGHKALDNASFSIPRQSITALVGINGSGKSTFLSEFLQDVFTGVYQKITGAQPSLLLASTTNEQCKKLFELVMSESLRDESSVPKATWCVSHEYFQKSKDANDVLTVQNANEKHHRPRKNHIYVCTHDYAAERYTGSYFDVVVLDEIGALDLYKGSTLVGLARRMAKLMGDTPQGSRPCATLADKHVQNVSDFKTHSYRCPQKVMEIVQPAYQAKFGDQFLKLTGVVRSTTLVRPDELQC